LQHPMKSFSFYYFLCIYLLSRPNDTSPRRSNTQFLPILPRYFRARTQINTFRPLAHAREFLRCLDIWLHDTNDTCCRLARPPDLARAATVVCVIGTLSSTRCCSRVQFFTSATTPASVNGEKRGEGEGGKEGEKERGKKEEWFI